MAWALWLLLAHTWRRRPRWLPRGPGVRPAASPAHPDAVSWGCECRLMSRTDMHSHRGSRRKGGRGGGGGGAGSTGFMLTTILSLLAAPPGGGSQCFSITAARMVTVFWIILAEELSASPTHFTLRFFPLSSLPQRLNYLTFYEDGFEGNVDGR